jgi:phage gp16-like protein
MTLIQAMKSGVLGRWEQRTRGQSSPIRGFRWLRCLPDVSPMRASPFLVAAVAIGSAVVAVSPAAAAPAAQSAWAAQANKVCVVWLAKAKKEFGTPVTTAQLYSFAVKAKALENQELGVLEQIPGNTSTGTAALTAMKVDIAEVGSSITAWNQGNAALFVQILKRYLDDGRAKSAFALAGASQCG